MRSLRIDGGDPINRGQLLWMPLDENGGLIARDITPYRQNGTLTNGPTRGLGAPGRVTAFAGGGAGSPYIQTNARPELVAAQLPLTIAVWVYPTGSGTRTAFGQYWDFSAAGDIGKMIRIESGNVVYYTTSSSSAFQNVTGGAVANDVWSLIVVTISGTVAAPTYAITVNQTTATGSLGALLGAGPNDRPIYVGNSRRNVLFGPGEGFNGRLAHVRVWDRALTPTERMRLYRDRWAGATSGRRRFIDDAAAGPNEATITGTIPITGSLSATLGLAAVIAGTVPVTGSATAAMALAAEIAGLLPVTGQITASFPNAATITGTIPITGLITATTGGLDTHDGFVRRSRREKRIAAAQAKTQAERLADAQALRLALEAALGVVAEVPTPAMPVAVAKAVDAAPKPAEVDWRKVAEEPAEYVRLAARVQRLVAAVQSAADRQRELAEDDEEVAFVLGMI